MVTITFKEQGSIALLYATPAHIHMELDDAEYTMERDEAKKLMLWLQTQLTGEPNDRLPHPGAHPPR